MNLQQAPLDGHDAQPASPEGTSARLGRHWFLVLGAVIVIVVGAAAFWLNRPEQPKSATNTAVPQTETTLKDPVVGMDIVVKGLSAPTTIAAAPEASDERLYITEQAGRVRIASAGGLAPKPLLDITPKVYFSGEMGLLGLAFHPDYRQNGHFYVNYVDKSQRTVIARFTAKNGEADAGSEKVLLTLKQPYVNHNGGGVAFGRDGYLYVSLGDGGSAGDPQNRAQDRHTLFGKILRLDVDKGNPYAIPSDNPFAAAKDARPEIWAYGLRNPWRISFDKKTGDLYIADVGQGDYEELNVQKAGAKGGQNYGWPCWEGLHKFRLDSCSGLGAYRKPIAEYDHDGGRCSVTGGYVYRGDKYPALAGKYFYGDFCNGQLFYADSRGGKWVQTEAAKTPYAISTFGQDNNGELYAADYRTGAIYRIKDTANKL